MPGKPFKRKSGSWAVVVERAPGPDGKRRQRWLSGRTRREVEEKQAKALREIHTGTDLDPTRLTVGAYLAHWLETVVRPSGRRQSTYERYEIYIRRQLAPALGTIPLTRLQPGHLSGLYAALGDAGLSAQTVAGCHVVLRAALDQAVRWQMLPRNVAAAVRPPRVRHRTPDLWDTATARRFLRAIRGHRLEVFFVCAVRASLRRGELLGLAWSAVDLDRATLAVRRARVRTRAGVVDEEPKTARGRRAVELSPETVGALRAHRARQLAERLVAGAAWEEHGLVFCGATGRPLTPTNVAYHWERLTARAGVPRMPFHNLRHLGPTLMLEAGIHPKIVQERLGHSSISVTLDVYSHVVPGLQRQAAAALDAALADPEGDEDGGSLVRGDTG